jgi:hypothetical protein
LGLLDLFLVVLGVHLDRSSIFDLIWMRVAHHQKLARDVQIVAPHLLHHVQETEVLIRDLDDGDFENVDSCDLIRYIRTSKGPSNWSRCSRSDLIGCLIDDEGFGAYRRLDCLHAYVPAIGHVKVCFSNARIAHMEPQSHLAAANPTVWYGMNANPPWRGR